MRSEMEKESGDTLMRITLTLLCTIVFVGCSAETPEARYAGHLPEQPIGYQPDHIDDRSVARSQRQLNAAGAGGQARRDSQPGIDQERSRNEAISRRTPQINRSVGDDVSVTGRIVAGKKTRGGTVKEILIWDGAEEFQLASADARTRMLAHLGQRVQLEGTVTRVGDGSTILKVRDYKILDDPERKRPVE